MRETLFDDIDGVDIGGIDLGGYGDGVDIGGHAW